MWAWLRLGWGRGLVLAALLVGANFAAQRYAQGTVNVTRTPEFLSLGGLRAWRVDHTQPRRSGLMDSYVFPNRRALLRMSQQGHPSLWRVNEPVFVRKLGERGGISTAVAVGVGLELPQDACWLMERGAASASTRIWLRDELSCTPLQSEEDAWPSSARGTTQRDVRALWGGEVAVLISPELAERAFGPDWYSYTSRVWLGAGALPALAPDGATAGAKESKAQPPASLQALGVDGWTIEEIRNAPSSLELLAQASRQRWQWAMAALGVALGALSAWGYRHVLALTVALRRTGGAGWLVRWQDALALSFAVAALLIASGLVLLVLQQLCGSSCGAGGAMGANGATLAKAGLWRGLAESAGWLLWSWSGLALGLLAVTSGWVLVASRRSLQALFARGAAG